MEKTFNKVILYVLLFSIIVLLFLINDSAFIEKNPTCNNFVVNVYLYLALSISLIGVFSYLINYLLYGNTTKYFKALDMLEIFKSIGAYYIVSIILVFVFIILIAISKDYDTKNTLYNHSIWAIFLFLISVTIFPKFKDIATYEYIDDALLITTIIFLVMTGVYYTFSDFFMEKYNQIGLGLFVALISIIIIEIIHILFYNNNSFGVFKLTSYFVIVLFSLYVSYDTATIIKKEDLCVDYPNYPKFSIDFFLDILNLFSRILFLKRK